MCEETFEALAAEIRRREGFYMVRELRHGRIAYSKGLSVLGGTPPEVLGRMTHPHDFVRLQDLISLTLKLGEAEGVLRVVDFRKPRHSYVKILWRSRRVDCADHCQRCSAIVTQTIIL